MDATVEPEEPALAGEKHRLEQIFSGHGFLWENRKIRKEDTKPWMRT